MVSIEWVLAGPSSALALKRRRDLVVKYIVCCVTIQRDCGAVAASTIKPPIGRLIQEVQVRARHAKVSCWEVFPK